MGEGLKHLPPPPSFLSSALYTRDTGWFANSIHSSVQSANIRQWWKKESANVNFYIISIILVKHVYSLHALDVLNISIIFSSLEKKQTNPKHILQYVSLHKYIKILQQIFIHVYQFKIVIL
jgi:hypothetical protein